MLKGIDISAWQEPRTIDYDLLAKNIDFVVLRVGVTGYGANPPHTNNFNKDKHFDTHHAEFVKRGIPVGVYWYGGAVTTAEVDKELAVMFAAIKGKKIEYPVYYDVEENRNHGTLSKAKLTEITKYFCAQVEKAGYFTGIYASLHWTNSKLNMAQLPYSLWLAHWGVNKPGKDCGMWQYTSDGKLPGHAGRLDMNIANEDFKAIIANAGLNHLGGANTKPPVEKPADPVKPPVQPPVSNAGYKVGQTVYYKGTVYGDSYGGKPGATVAGNYPITIVNGNPFGVHLGSIGWVKPGNIGGTPTAPTPIGVGTRVRYNGPVYADSYGGGKGANVNGTYTVTILNNNPYGAHIGGIGWVKKSDLVKA